MSAPLELRPARAEDAERLREVMAAAKGHWGCDPELVAGWAASVDMAATLREQEVWVADVGPRVVAWAGLVPPRDGVAQLDHLWVEPGAMHRGIGSALFRRAADRAAELGAHRLEWEAEPNALGFYEHMGGRHLRDVTSEWGRPLSVMGVDLPSRPSLAPSRHG
ncbi:MAG: GNAT family N-acetyltransferase [Gaiellales bacterium]